MVKSRSSKIIMMIIVVILLGFIILGPSLILHPTNVGIVINRIKLEDGSRELIYNFENLKVLNKLTIKALEVSILLFIIYLAVAILKLFVVSEKNEDKLKKLILALLLVGMTIAIVLIAYYIYILIRFPKDYDKYNNYAYALGVANIIFLTSLIALTTILVWLTFTSQKESKTTINIQVVTEGAMMVALSVVLSVLGDLIPWINNAFGGGVSLSMLPIFIFAFRRGIAPGALVGFSYGVVNLLIDGVLHWGSIFFDYFLPYTLVGLIAGLFAKKAQKGLIGYSMLAVFLGGFARYLCHSLSGVIFFSDYAPEGMTAFYYSFIFYNAPYMAVNIVLNLIIIFAVHSRLITKDSRVV